MGQSRHYLLWAYKMKTTKKTILLTTLITYLFALVTLTWAAEEQETSESAFESCIEELKDSVGSSTEEGLGNNFEPELSLEESIRIFDECLNREGVTLTIHGTLGEGGGANAANRDGMVSSGTDGGATGNETNSQTAENGERSASTATSSGQSSSLEPSLHEFDTMLSQIQDEIASDHDAQLAQAAKESNGTTQTKLDTTAEQQENSEGVTGEQTEESPSSSSATVSAEAKHEDTKERVPLDPKDEDIVLKTIREAAELETNPTTKQALWDQYYDYADKNN